MKKVLVRCPATVANLVCGFDILGMALNEPFDEIEASLLDHPGIRIFHDDEFNLPADPQQNVAGAALLALSEAYEKPIGIGLRIKKKIKPGSGLGSSAASAAGAVAAANHLLGNPFSKDQLVGFAMYGEKLASGVKHADNIAPCIYGGVTLIRSIFPLDIVELSYPPVFITIVHPQIEVKTSDARQILRKEVQLRDAIRQWGNIAGLVSGFMKKDTALIGRSLEDVIIEPVRSILIPGFDEIKEKSRKAGALGGGISGSGPSVFMLSENEKTARNIETQMKSVCSKYEMQFQTYVTTINTAGIRLMEI